MLPTLRSTRRVGIETPDKIEVPPTSLLSKQPGNNWDDVAFKKKHARSQGLQRELLGSAAQPYKQQVLKPVEQDRDMLSTTQTLLQCVTGAAAVPPPTRLEDLDDRVLRFYGYWREASIESAVEASRLRKVVICVFPHDGTVMVQEPKVPNSGIQGGTLVKRHRIPAGLETARKRNAERDPSRRIPSEAIAEGEEFMGPADFRVGDTVTIYGKCIRLIDCDGATRQFLEALGEDVAEAEDYPPDEYFAEYKAPAARKGRAFADFDLRKTFEHAAKGRVTSYYPNEVQRVKAFLASDSRVCRFWASWEDPHGPHSEKRRFEVRCHLHDGTMEVIERIAPNSGREPVRAFLKRAKIPKQPGASRAADLTFATRANGHRFEAPDGVSEDEFFYTVADLRIGATLNVFGRHLRIYACDPSTREFFRRELQVELDPDEEWVPPQQTPQPPVVQPPRHDGFGTEEDSLGNCRSLVLRPPRQDIAKWHRHANNLLRFKMKLHNVTDSNDAIRRFILTFYMADDTLMINEVSVRNTGYLAGRFLRRQRAKKYDGEGAQCYYTQEDIYPGAVLRISGHEFEVVEMDQFTETFKAGGLAPPQPGDVQPERVEELAGQLRRAIGAKHVTLTDAFRQYDTDRDGFLALDEVQVMFKNLNIAATESELVVLAHHLDTDGDGKLSLGEFVAAITGDVVKSALDGRRAEFGSVAPIANEAGEKYIAEAAQRPAAVRRDRVLRTLHEKLSARQINVFEMYRMLSTMPAAHKTGRCDAASVGNGGTDALLGPVQLRRGLTERFSFEFSDEDMRLLMQFFFPDLPEEMYDLPREQTAAYRMSLPQFQEKWSYLERLGQLVPDMSLRS